MTELDLTEAIEAGRDAGLATQCEREPSGCMGECYDAAVRVAAPIIERAVREEDAEEIANLRAIIDQCRTLVTELVRKDNTGFGCAPDGRIGANDTLALQSLLGLSMTHRRANEGLAGG